MRKPEPSIAEDAETTTTVIRHIIPGKEKEFDTWMHRLATALEPVSGFLSVTVVTPAKEAEVRYIVFTFESKESYTVWEHSALKKSFFTELRGIARQHVAHKSGLETWFTLREFVAHAPPKWKMAVASFSGVFLVSIILRSLLEPITRTWSLPLATALYASLTVAILTWLYMPQFTKVFKGWLYPEK